RTHLARNATAGCYEPTGIRNLLMTEILDDNYALIPHSTQPEVLLLAEGNSWTLPRHHFNEAIDIHQAMRTQLGLDVTVLDAVYDRFKGEREEKHIIYATDNHSLRWSPQNARWVGRESLAELSLVVPEHQAVLNAWFDEIEHGSIPPRRVP